MSLYSHDAGVVCSFVGNKNNPTQKTAQDILKQKDYTKMNERSQASRLKNIEKAKQAYNMKKLIPCHQW